MEILLNLQRTQEVSPQAGAVSNRAESGGKPPWYRRTLRWGQTNITEIDAQRYDIPWWRQHWKRTRVQGVFINAGGIVASYPSNIPLHRRAAGLGDRDLFGELASAAHTDGLVVIARMDSNRVHEESYRAHPDWLPRDADGRPCHLYRQQDRLVLHLVNLTNAGAWRGPVDGLISIGPLGVRVKLPDGVRGRPVRSLVSNRSLQATVKNGWAHFDPPIILDHEVVVIG